VAVTIPIAIMGAPGRKYTGIYSHGAYTPCRSQPTQQACGSIPQGEIAQAVVIVGSSRMSIKGGMSIKGVMSIKGGMRWNK